MNYYKLNCNDGHLYMVIVSFVGVLLSRNIYIERNDKLHNRSGASITIQKTYSLYHPIFLPVFSFTFKFELFHFYSLFEYLIVKTHINIPIISDTCKGTFGTGTHLLRIRPQAIA